MLSSLLGSVLVYLGVGALAGVLAGLLGIGGGLIIVAALVWLLPLSGIAAEHVMHVALATSLASIVFTASASARAHQRRGSVLWPSVWRLLPGLLLGAGLGALLATRLSGDTLRWLVAGYCLVSAVQMLLGRGARQTETRDAAPRSPWLVVAGVIIGAVSAVVGIGGGSLTVPFLVHLRVAPVRAVGTSSACGVAIAVASALSYALSGPAGGLSQASIGYVYLPAVLGIAAASMLAAPWGTRLAHALSGRALNRVFAVFLLVVGLLLVWGG